ncbi:hypothetical protein SCP_0408860 [Sparassis crispa]|uniref:Uncharacterized protein n=1 Tax=Sparassis crispa TaxID=139825 RepID=A0A401GK17_9APHY|nr:hypothetical protein SCP_0408860 [Sparassis crispa]GBE82502.1 hypothetical protein SCP_0408860 [Sparassis crispa]
MTAFNISDSDLLAILDYVRTRKDVPPHIMAILENVDKASLPPDGVYPTPSSSHIQSPFPMHARPLNSLPLPVPAGSSALPSITEESNEGEVVLGLITIRGAPSPGRDSPPVQPGPRLSPPPQADGPPDVENVAQQDQVDQSERSDNSDGSDDSIEEPLAQAVRRLAGALPLPRDNCPRGGVRPRKPSQRRNHRQGQHGEQDMFEDHDLFAGEGAEENENDDDEEPGDPAGHDNLPKGSPAKWGISDLPAALNGWPGKTATKFLCDLISGAHGNFQAPSVSIWVESMKDLVEGRSWDAHDGAFRTNALWALVSRVSRAEKVLSGAEFVSMMTKIQLAAKVDSIQKTRNTQVAKGGKMTMAQVYSLISEEPDAPKEKTFSEWVAFGHRFAALAGAGSVYLLMIIAAHGMYSQIGRTKQATIWTMCNCLRWPNPDTLIGQHILGRLIPLASGLSSNIDCRDFVSSDKFFSMFITNTFRSVDRHSESWAPCMTPLTSPLTELEQGMTGVDLMVQNILTTASSTCSTRPPSTRAPSPMDDSDDEHHATTIGVCENSDNNDDLFMVDAQSKKFYTPDSSSPNYLVFDTDFRPQAKKNRKAPYPKTDPKERLVWTDEQRHYAGDAWVAKTLENFEEGIQEHYNKDGVKFANSYIYLSRSAFEGKEIRLNSKEGELLAFIASDMSQDMKDTLERGLRSVIFSDGSPEYELQSMDSSASTGQHQFPCIHFSRYARHITRGDDAPTNIHPLFLYKVECGHTNHHQFTPYFSKELWEHEEEYDSLSKVFEEFCEWMQAKRLPEVYKSLEIFAEVLPGREVSPCHPFTSMVLNVNVVTHVHRDVKDLKACLVLVLGDHTGGDLCLVEPGLVFPLRAGDLVVFHSGDVTHFNLHYRGERASLVLHSDAEGKHWQEDQMGWKDNDYMAVA